MPLSMPVILNKSGGEAVSKPVQVHQSLKSDLTTPLQGDGQFHTLTGSTAGKNYLKESGNRSKI